MFSLASLITAKVFDGFEPIVVVGSTYVVGFRSSYEWLIVLVFTEGLASIG